LVDLCVLNRRSPAVLSGKLLEPIVINHNAWNVERDIEPVLAVSNVYELTGSEHVIYFSHLFS